VLILQSIADGTSIARLPISETLNHANSIKNPGSSIFKDIYPKTRTSQKQMTKKSKWKKERPKNTKLISNPLISTDRKQNTPGKEIDSLVDNDNDDMSAIHAPVQTPKPIKSIKRKRQEIHAKSTSIFDGFCMTVMML
jgi:hypothetical protein